MDSLIFDKIKVKINFPSQTLLEERNLRSKILSVSLDELRGGYPSRTLAALFCRICKSDIMVSLFLSPHITSQSL